MEETDGEMPALAGKAASNNNKSAFLNQTVPN